jgi:hypothetical protein
MASPETAKPATARHGEPVSNSEQLGSGLDQSNTPRGAELQARWLTRRFLLSSAMAWSVAPLAFGEVRA